MSNYDLRLTSSKSSPQKLITSLNSESLSLRNFKCELLIYRINFVTKASWKRFCGALRDLVAFVQLKKREKHPWRSVNFSKVAGFSFLNCTNGTKRVTHHRFLWMYLLDIASYSHNQNIALMIEDFVFFKKVLVQG